MSVISSGTGVRCAHRPREAFSDIRRLPRD